MLDVQFPVFDFHTHCFPEAIAARSIDLLSVKAGIPAYHDGTAQGLAAYERAGGAAGYLVLPIATKPSQARSILEFAIALNDGQNGRRSLGSVHPDDPDYALWLDKIADAGLPGIKLHAEYQDFYVGDPRYAPFFDAIFDRGLFVLLHAGGDLGFENPIHSEPEGIAALCDRHPDGRIVAAHMGGFERWPRVRQHLAGRDNLWLDCSYAAGVMPDDDFYALATAHGTDRILFATDSPWRPFDDTLAAVLRAGFADDQLRAILFENARALLGMPD